MLASNDLFLIQQLSNIRVEMEKQSKTDTILITEETSALFSIYFLDSSKNVGSNETIFKAIEKIKEKFDLKIFTTGKAVMGYLEERVEC